VAVVGIGLAIGARSALSWTGWGTSFFTAAGGFVALLTAWSFSVEGRRRAKDRLASTLIAACFVAAIVPLVLILSYIVIRGVSAFNVTFFTHSMAGVTASMAGGGIYHAIVGTLQQVGIAAVIAIPIGLFTAIYLVEYGRRRLRAGVTFFVDVMTGIPSIVAGLFVYACPLLGPAGRFGFGRCRWPWRAHAPDRGAVDRGDAAPGAATSCGRPRTRWASRSGAPILEVVVPTARRGLITGSCCRSRGSPVRPRRC
jgi:phosphate transport system permease protein